MGSCLLPSLNSSKVNLASLFRSMIRKILSTRYTTRQLRPCIARTPALKTHLLRGILVLGQSDHLSRHLVYRSHNLQHLIVGDIPVLVDIVQLERPWDMSVEAKGLDGINATAPAGPCYSHLSFSSSRPREVTERAQINSLNSIVPDLSSSNTLKT